MAGVLPELHQHRYHGLCNDGTSSQPSRISWDSSDNMMSSQTSARRRNYDGLVVVHVIVLLLLSSAAVARQGVECKTTPNSPDLSAIDQLRSHVRNRDSCIPTNALGSSCTTWIGVAGAKVSVCHAVLFVDRDCGIVEAGIEYIQDACQRYIGGTTRSGGYYWFPAESPVFEDWYVALW